MIFLKYMKIQRNCEIFEEINNTVFSTKLIEEHSIFFNYIHENTNWYKNSQYINNEY